MTGWTPDRIATAKRLWLEGKSASEIMRVLRADCGGGLWPTRNAVIGKLLRVGALGSRVAAAKPERRPAPLPTPKLVRIPRDAVLAPDELAVVIAPGVAPATARPWMTRTLGECARPFMVGGETYSCCAEVGHENPTWQYCPSCRRTMFAPPPKPMREDDGRRLNRRRAA